MQLLLSQRRTEYTALGDTVQEKITTTHDPWMSTYLTQVSIKQMMLLSELELFFFNSYWYIMFMNIGAMVQFLKIQINIQHKYLLQFLTNGGHYQYQPKMIHSMK